LKEPRAISDPGGTEHDSHSIIEDLEVGTAIQDDARSSRFANG